MKPAPFDYFAPNSLVEALEVLNEYGFDAKLLAGGQSLIPAMNFRLSHPSYIIDLNRVQGLSKIQTDEYQGLRIGAMVRHSELEYDSNIPQISPLIHEVMPHIAHPQIRNRGTIGGSLAHADPASELPVIMTALQANFRLERQGSERWVKAAEFFEGLFTTALEPEEILVEIAVPPREKNTGYAFSELARRHGDYAQAGVAAVITLDDGGKCRQARLVYLNAGDIPMDAHQAAALLIGEVPTENLIEEAAYLASTQEIAPTADIHATAEYKRHLAFVLGKRTIQSAILRAKAALQS